MYYKMQYHNIYLHNCRTEILLRTQTGGGATIKDIYDEGRSIVYFPSAALLLSPMSAFLEQLDVKANTALQRGEAWEIEQREIHCREN